MKKAFLLSYFLVIFVLIAGCGPSSEGFDPYWTLVPVQKVYTSANPVTPVIGELKYGDKVWGHESNLGALVPKDWIEIKFGENYGYVPRRGLADKETRKKLEQLAKEVKKETVQATGKTVKKTPFRAGPSRSAKLIEKIRNPVGVEVFGRVVVDRKLRNKTVKEGWYKIRLNDGRVGYVHSRNVRVTPPKEINQYTSIRKTIGWQKIRDKEDKESGNKGTEYIVVYLSSGIPSKADFSRYELYTYDAKKGQYGTALAKGGIYGKLPLIVRDDGDGRKIIEIRQLSQRKKDTLVVQEYSFPHPIRMVKEYEVALNPETETEK